MIGALAEVSTIYSMENVSTILVVSSLMAGLHTQVFNRLTEECDPLCQFQYVLNYTGIMNWITTTSVGVISIVLDNSSPFINRVLGGMLLISFMNTGITMFISNIRYFDLFPWITGLMCSLVGIYIINLSLLLYNERKKVLLERKKLIENGSTENGSNGSTEQIYGQV